MTTERTSTPVRPGEVPAGADPATARRAEVVGALLQRVWDVVAELDVTYAEYDAAKDWLIAVGEAGEWPLCLDVFVERAVERQAAARSRAGQSAIQGPFYVPGAAERGARGTVPMRADEKGDRLVVRGRVLSSDGVPLRDAVVDHWQADADGCYSHFHPTPPAGNLRGRFTTGADGGFEIHTVVPAPYQIPHDGPTGQLLAACGWHPWRPAHLHYFVDAPGHDRLTTQLFFAGDPWLGTDVAGADKPDLVVTPTPTTTGELEVRYDFVLETGADRRQAISAAY
jgi:catechol 1,2-dioxygenase